MKNSIVLIIMGLLFGCQPGQTQQEAQKSEPEPKTDHHSQTITRIFEAHGGFEKWASMKQLSYVKKGETTITNLVNRKIRLESEKETIGFDGEKVWIAPDTVDASRTRFYHNLYFYFYSMPFVVGDPGVFYEDVSPMEIKGQTLNGVKISYGENVGDSPDDYYIIWYNPESYRMEWLMYTVTYRSGEINENYRLIKYNEWQEVEEISLPTSIQWHNYKEGVIGEMSREVLFEEVKLSTDIPDDQLFEMPENAQIAPRAETN